MKLRITADIEREKEINCSNCPLAHYSGNEIFCAVLGEDVDEFACSNDPRVKQIHWLCPIKVEKLEPES